MQKKRPDLDRALARRTDWARRVAVIVVALAAAAATFFFFSPMANCQTPVLSPPVRVSVPVPVPEELTVQTRARAHAPGEPQCPPK